MRNVVCTAIVLGLFSACGGHYHGYYEVPPPVEYRHYHRLACDHRVECSYYGGAHHYTPHGGHDRYWHVHRTERGGYKRCYVVRRRHDH